MFVGARKMFVDAEFRCKAPTHNGVFQKSNPTPHTLTIIMLLHNYLRKRIYTVLNRYIINYIYKDIR